MNLRAILGGFHPHAVRRQPSREFELNEDTGALLFYLALISFFGIGWVMNVIHISHWNGSVGVLALQICGVFLAPLGGLLGWLL